MLTYKNFYSVPSNGYFKFLKCVKCIESLKKIQGWISVDNHIIRQQQQGYVADN